jgi:hypothetical protein
MMLYWFSVIAPVWAKIRLGEPTERSMEFRIET